MRKCGTEAKLPGGKLQWTAGFARLSRDLVNKFGGTRLIGNQFIIHKESVSNQA